MPRRGRRPSPASTPSPAPGSRGHGRLGRRPSRPNATCTAGRPTARRPPESYRWGPSCQHESEMAETFIARVSLTINAPRAKVWDALVDPEKIKQYILASDVVSQWREGSS